MNKVFRVVISVISRPC